MPYLPTTTKYKWIRKIKKDYNTSYSKPEYAKIYQSNRWRKLRNWYIKNNPMCVMCRKKNITKAAYVVDHIIEIADGGNVWDVNNLQSLCDYHHRYKTAKAVNKRRYNNNNSSASYKKKNK